MEHLPDPRAFIERVAARLLPRRTLRGLGAGDALHGREPASSARLHPHSFRKLLAAHGLKEFDCLSQIQPYGPMAVATRTETRMAAMRRNILAYYCRHPGKALLRAKSIIVDGFSNKYLTIAAKSARNSAQNCPVR